MLADRLLVAIEAIVGDNYLLVDPDLTAKYRTDWTGRFHSGPLPVVRPGSSDEVRRIVAMANAERFHIVPQGGNTGLVGGGIPTSENTLLVSTERLRAIGPVDLVGGTVTVESGVTLAELQDSLRSTEWIFGVDLGARASCTLGGMAATNAGGINVVRYGTMRRQVLGVEAVLGDSTLISHMAALDKDNTGYDLEGILTGSEGTLAVLTKLVLRLRPRPQRVSTALLALSDVETAVRVASDLRRTVASLESLEFMLGVGLKLVQQAFGGEPPWLIDDATALLLVEVAGDGDVETDLALACERIEADLIAEPAVAAGPTARTALWRWREEHTAAIATLGVPLKLDVSVPIRAIPAFLRELAELPLLSPPIVFGHLGDGNLHVNVPRAFAATTATAVEREAQDHRAEQMETLILRLVTQYGGSISAEHGIGVAKAGHLPMNRSAGEIHAFARLKNAFDPNGVLNPGVLLPV